MNVDYVRQVAAECDDLVKRATRPLTHGGIDIPTENELMAALIRAAAVLHTAVLPPESHGERPNGSGSVQDTGETPTGQQRTAEGDQIADMARAAFRRAVAKALGRDDEGRHEIELIDEIADLRDERSQIRDLLGLRTQEAEGYRKRWHEAATQRDALLQTAKDTVQLDPLGHAMPKAMDRLAALIEALEAGGCPIVPPSADRLRRELWHVLDRMPASDDNLIATVKQLLNDRDLLGKSREHVERERDQARSQRDRLLRDARAIQRTHDLTKTDEVVVELENTIVRIEHELGL